jgi:(p)ppGpp synthase/HD superfamily hydrolase
MSDTQLFDAIEFAARAHAGQYRKGTRIPYIVHPLAVARILIEHDAPENVVVAAVLHDVVEDTRVTLPEIRAAFGNDVAGLVEGMSEPNRRDTWEHRKQHTLDWLATAPLNVVLIKVADQLDNIRGIRADYLTQGDAVWKRFNRGREKQKWYHKGLADVFQRRLTSPQGQILAREFTEHVRAVFGE